MTTDALTMLKRTKDISGQRFGRLTVLSFAGYKQLKGRRISTWYCLCDCGNNFTVRLDSLVTNRTRSCGCLHSEVARVTCKANTVTHGLSETREYDIWLSMKQRCYDKNCPAYLMYGAVGIQMADAFRDSFESFIDYIGMSPSDKHSIDRIDRSKGYVKGNIRWATPEQQARNKGKMKNNSSGITGVSFRQYRDNDLTYWVAMWNEVPEAGKVLRKFKTFSVKKLGYQEAFNLAVEYRKEQIQRLNSLGYGYAEDHGE